MLLPLQSSALKTPGMRNLRSLKREAVLGGHQMVEVRQHIESDVALSLLRSFAPFSTAIVDVQSRRRLHFRKMVEMKREKSFSQLMPSRSAVVTAFSFSPLHKCPHGGTEPPPPPPLLSAAAACGWLRGRRPRPRRRRRRLDMLQRRQPCCSQSPPTIAVASVATAAGFAMIYDKEAEEEEEVVCPSVRPSVRQSVLRYSFLHSVPTPDVPLLLAMKAHLKLPSRNTRYSNESNPTL